MAAALKRRVRTVTPDCRHPFLPPELAAWTRLLRTTILDHADKLLQRVHPVHERWWSNVPPLLRVAKGLLRSSPFQVRQSDKDGCFVLATDSDLRRARQRAMPETKYLRTSILNIQINNIKRDYASLVSRIAAFYEEPIGEDFSYPDW